MNEAMMEIYLNLLTDDNKAWYTNATCLEIDWNEALYAEVKEREIGLALKELGIEPLCDS